MTTSTDTTGSSDGDERFSAPFWDERYGTQDRFWSGDPNPQLVDEASGLTPGRALEVGAGEGADARWLAGRGWTVHAVDVSPVGLEHAAALTDATLAERITWTPADARAWVPEAGAYDLVTAFFLHFPSADRVPVYARLAAAVAPGGTLLVVAHHPSDLDTAVPRPHEPDLFFTAEDLVAELEPARWEIVTAEARPRAALGEGDTVTVHDTVLRAARL